MKTLILNGSPRKNGDTASLLKILLSKLEGEVRVIDTYFCNIEPCIDCRHCWENQGCCVNDEMQSVYDYIRECDNILIASPIYFSELTGKLLGVASRLQAYFCARYFRKETLIIKPKKGAIILVGGGDGHMEKAYDTAKTMLRHMNTIDIFPLVSYHNTNILPAVESRDMLMSIDKISAFFRM